MDRYAVDLTVELFADGTERRVALADLSKSGAFLKVTPPLPIGEPIHVAMFFEGRQLAVPATVVHSLDDRDARALGRPAGIGVAFDPPTRHADMLFVRAVERLLADRPRVAARVAKSEERVVLRGDLAEITLPAVLVMLEQEKKSCRVALRAGAVSAWIELAHGMIVDARSTLVASDLRGVVMSLLDWTRGELELVVGHPASPATTGLSITYALIEHARICDERTARKYVA